MNQNHKKRSILIALFIAVLGLAIVPGCKLTAEDKEGNKITVE